VICDPRDEGPIIITVYEPSLIEWGPDFRTKRRCPLITATYSIKKTEVTISINGIKFTFSYDTVESEVIAISLRRSNSDGILLGPL